MNRTDRTKLLAEEARHLAERCDALSRRVTTAVDRVIALDARAAGMRLEMLSQALEELAE